MRYNERFVTGLNQYKRYRPRYIVGGYEDNNFENTELPPLRKWAKQIGSKVKEGIKRSPEIAYIGSKWLADKFTRGIVAANDAIQAPVAYSISPVGFGGSGNLEERKEPLHLMYNVHIGLDRTPSSYSFTPYRGGSFSGSGVDGSFKVYDASRYKTFNEAFDAAVATNAETFKWAGHLYNTEKETNPIREYNNRFVGNSRNYEEVSQLPDSVFIDDEVPLHTPFNLIKQVVPTYDPYEPTQKGNYMNKKDASRVHKIMKYDTKLRSSNERPTSVTFAEGGRIYIKPSHRGRFTALKERTGHSATWFKEHGTPAQKKMATFALNAKHWKH